jgi:glycosyltransferase involved in cell wall biosynthesis
MPVFNGGEYLRDSLQAVLSQTFTDFELIVSDNASTDDTERIGREYGERDGRVRFIRHQRNIGAFGNFEFVLSEARGRYFMWAAADDLISPDWVAHLVRNFRETDFGVFGEYQYIGESGKTEGAPSTPRHLRRNSQLTTFLLPDTCGKCFYIYSLFRREELASLRIFADRPFLGNDQIMILRLLEHGDLRSSPGAVMKYRLHDANTSSSESRQQGAYRRMLFSTFPATYYRHAVAALPIGKRALALPLVPLKYVFEQSRSYKMFLGLLLRKGKDVVRSRAHLRRHAGAKG